MQAAFGFGTSLPPAAPFFKIEGVPFAGARHAPDAFVAVVFQGMAWEIVGLNVAVHVSGIPLEHGMVAKHSSGIRFEPGLFRTDLALVRSNAADPNVTRVQKGAHGLDFVEVAARVNVRGKQKITVLGHLLGKRAFAAHFKQLDAELLRQRMGKEVGFWKQEARVNHDHLHGILRQLRYHMQQRDTLGLEGGSQVNRARLQLEPLHVRANSVKGVFKK